MIYPDATATATRTVLVYSDDRNLREQVRLALGRQPAADLPPVEYLECATAPAVTKALGRGGIDLCIFDGEATPAGGLGVCRQVKDEVYSCPPVVVLIGRPEDSWLAAWSRADAALVRPVDSAELKAVFTRLQGHGPGR